MDSKICFEMSLFVVEAIRGRCGSFMILTATVSEICGGQTNVPILVVIVASVDQQSAILFEFISCLHPYYELLSVGFACNVDAIYVYCS